MPPIGLRPVFVLAIPAPADPWLDHPRLQLALADRVSVWPPAAEAQGEHLEGEGLGSLDLDAAAHGSWRDGLHLSSLPSPSAGSLPERPVSVLRAASALLSTSALKASSAMPQNWSSQARSAPSPAGSMR